MSETKYLKCPCQKCGASIEFPAHGIGSAVPCPHCGDKTTLFAPPAVAGPPAATTALPGGSTPVAVADESTPTTSASSQAAESFPEIPAPAGRPRGRWLAAALLAVLLAGTGAAIFRHRPMGSRSAVLNDPALTGNVRTASSKIPDSTQASPPIATANTAKSPDDLKVGVITLEKAKGSSLVYAVGILRNESGHQRFGVNIELELADAKGNKAGVAKDYRSVIEPRQEWRFRALVLDSKAVSAKLARIREEE
jgi:hypothetical protein